MNKIFRLNDDLEVEIELNKDQAREISADQRINASINDVNSFLSKVIKPISSTYQELSKEVEVSEAKITLGVKVSVEGGFILAKSAAEAHLQIEVAMRKPNE